MIGDGTSRANLYREDGHPNMGTPADRALAVEVIADRFCRETHSWIRSRQDFTTARMYRGRRLLSCHECKIRANVEVIP